MVKLGFIVEGDTEKFLLESEDFKSLLKELHLDYVPQIINAKGNDNLLPHNIKEHSQILLDKGATRIIILTDLDKDACITKTKQRISPLENQTVVISIKEIEAWYLADTEAMRSFLATISFNDLYPESHPDPFDEIKNKRIEVRGRGVGDKKTLANLMINQNKFSFKRAAAHSNCTSAKYFINKLKELSTLS